MVSLVEPTHSERAEYKKNLIIFITFKFQEKKKHYQNNNSHFFTFLSFFLAAASATKLNNNNNQQQQPIKLSLKICLPFKFPALLIRLIRLNFLEYHSNQQQCLGTFHHYLIRHTSRFLTGNHEKSTLNSNLYGIETTHLG